MSELSDNEYYEIPKGYSLNNKLITLIIHSFLLGKQHDILEPEKLRLELATLLMEHLKTPVLKVIINKSNNELTGTVTTANDKDIQFNFKTPHLLENEN